MEGYHLQCPNCENLDTYYSAGEGAWLCQNCGMKFQFSTGYFDEQANELAPDDDFFKPEED